MKRLVTGRQILDTNGHVSMIQPIASVSQSECKADSIFGQKLIVLAGIHPILVGVQPRPCSRIKRISLCIKMIVPINRPATKTLYVRHVSTRLRRGSKLFNSHLTASSMAGYLVKPEWYMVNDHCSRVWLGNRQQRVRGGSPTVPLILNGVIQGDVSKRTGRRSLREYQRPVDHVLKRHVDGTVRRLTCNVIHFAIWSANRASYNKIIGTTLSKAYP